MDEDDFSSDSSDEDYVPNDGEQLSEEEESGDEEDFIPGQDDDNGGVERKDSSSGKSEKKPAGKSKKTADLNTRKRKGGIRLEEESHSQPTIVVEEPVLNNDLSFIVEIKKEEQVKKKADDLWSDFLKDVGGIKNSTSSSQSNATETPSITQPKVEAVKPATVKVTKEYDFAGETVTIVKEVSADSKEARLASSSQSESTSASPSVSAGVKRPSTGGLNSILNKIGKKDKISVLEKSKIDWDGFKQKEGIVDELKIHNRGKDGYLERQAFLNRTDHRQFEIERSLRQTTRPPNAQPRP